MKTETKHTPGPWKVSEYQKTHFNLRSGQATLATIYRNLGSPVTNEMDGQGEANARLIASAPDLLRQRDELIKMLTLLVGYEKFLDCPTPTTALIVFSEFKAARDLLARIEKESE